MTKTMKRVGKCSFWAVLSLALLSWLPTPGNAQQADAISALVQDSALTKVTKRKELRVGWNTWYPVMYNDPKAGKLSGFTVDLFETYLGPALNAKVVWVEQPWSTMIAGLQAGRFDIVAGGNRTYQRLLTAEFAGPLMQSGKGLIGLKTKIGRFKSWHDADNPDTKVCVALGTSADTDTTKYLPKANIMRLEGDPACIQAVAAGRADLHSWDLFSMRELERQNPEFQVVPDSIFTKSEMGMYIRQGDQVMLNWVNSFIREMKVQGVLDDLVKKYRAEGFTITRP